jgi:hypothetical protein
MNERVNDEAARKVLAQIDQLIFKMLILEAITKFMTMRGVQDGA